MSTVKRAPILILVGMGVAAVAISILAGVLGRSAGADTCNCISKTDAGFRAFSISWLILSLLVLVVILVWSIRGSSSIAYPRRF